MKRKAPGARSKASGVFVEKEDQNETNCLLQGVSYRKDINKSNARCYKRIKLSKNPGGRRDFLAFLHYSGSKCVHLFSRPAGEEVKNSNQRQKTEIAMHVCFAHFACGEIQSSVSRFAAASSFAKGAFWRANRLFNHPKAP